MKDSGIEGGGRSLASGLNSPPHSKYHVHHGETLKKDFHDKHISCNFHEIMLSKVRERQNIRIGVIKTSFTTAGAGSGCQWLRLEEIVVRSELAPPPVAARLGCTQEIGHGGPKAANIYAYIAESPYLPARPSSLLHPELL